MDLIHGIWQDARYAVRSLAKRRAFASAAIATLALGIGALAAMFALVYGVLLAPLPYGQPSRLISIDLQSRSPEVRRLEQPAGAYFIYTQFARRVEDVSFYRYGNANIWTTDGDAQAPERVSASWITASTIPLLAVQPLLGRSFSADEDRDRGPQAVILGESIWRSRFGGARDVIGKKVYVNSVEREIVGVMPERFQFPAADTRIWLPARLDRYGAGIGDFTYSAVARLASGATPALAERELNAIFPRIAESFPRLESGTPTTVWLDQTKASVIAVPLREETTTGIARTLWVLGLAALLVMLVACANVTNLLLIRSDARQLELAVREALGASRLRIITSFLAESFVLSATAAAVGLALAWAAVRALVTLGPAGVPRLSELHVGSETIVFVLIVTAATAALCAAGPAFRARGGALSISLRDGSRGDTIGRSRQRVRSTIAAGQMALTLVVVAASALLLRTFVHLYHQPPGFDSSNVITVWTQLPFARYGDSASVRFYARLTESVASLPGVQAAGVTSRLPLGGGETVRRSFRVEDGGKDVVMPTVVVDGGYLAAMRIPMLAGRGFGRVDVQRHDEMLISARAANTLWSDPTGNAAVGKRLMLSPGGPTYTVVGVAGDVRDQDLGIAPSSMLYLPQAAPIDTTQPAAQRTMALVVRLTGSPTTAVADIRRIARELDPTVPIFNVEAMSDVVRASTARLSLTLVLMSAAAAITLVLGAIGLYGVIAYMVALRTREFGVRIALGADPRRLAQSIVLHGLTLTAAGAGIGVALFSAAAPFLHASLYDVPATDPLTLGGAVVTLISVSALASWVPARRAANVDPAQALKAE